MKTTPEDVGLSGARLSKIDHVTRRYIDEGKLPGTITVVARRGEIAHFQSMGLMDVETAKPMADDALFRIYSMTKPITSVALMMLYEDGHFQLDDPVSKFYPPFKDLEVYNEQGNTKPDREMTIRDLLCHTSGLTYGFMRSTAVDKMYREDGIDSAENLEQMMAKLAKLPLLFSPGSQWSYSVATDVCGYLVEKISNTPLDEFFETQIFTPLGMHDTGFHVHEDKLHRLTACYERTKDNGLKLNDSPENSRYATKPGLLSGGGGLVSSAKDYYQFAQMLLNGGRLGDAQILGAKTLELMTSNHLPDNGDLTSMGQAVFSETPFDGIGFGLGFSVMLDPAKAQILGTPGEFAWGGAASTYFFIDPAEDMLVMFFSQLLPSSSYPIRRELRVTAYQSIID